jgi:hypothetical protein
VLEHPARQVAADRFEHVISYLVDLKGKPDIGESDQQEDHRWPAPTSCPISPTSTTPQSLAPPRRWWTDLPTSSTDLVSRAETRHRRAIMSFLSAEGDRILGVPYPV